MMYTIIVPNSVRKGLKKLDKPVVKKILDSLEVLSQKPTLGIPLSGNLAELRKLNIYHHKTEYRIVYRALHDQVEIHIIHIGTRENFYNELKRRL
ncbi:MAG: type II toxin-antitoxin system mRNA interferase toxin, RelE/StbE family [Firmicutes bacterium]|nr:type II toxin-antitoxin system mRNA interferase toxin, RelE/StbE family [Bacillota bacterium]